MLRPRRPTRTNPNPRHAGLKPWRQVLVLVGAILIGHYLAVHMLPDWVEIPPRSLAKDVVLEGILLLLALLPALWAFLLRPLRNQIRSLEKTESMMKHLMRQNNLILWTAREGILGLDAAGCIMFANPAAERILGRKREELIGRVHHDLVHHSYADGSAYPREQCPVHRSLQNGQVFHQHEECFWHRNGTSFPVEINCAPMKIEGDIVGAVITFRDIVDRKQAEARTRELAYFDSLTGLPNRLLLKDRFAQLLARARREKRIPALMFLDLNDFKKINDTCGHAVGDAYLGEIAERLRSAVRETDTVARLGGDEFIWAGNLSKPEQAGFIAENILAVLSRPVTLADRNFTNSASIGISLYPEDGNDFDSLLQAADLAMYRAKNDGKGGYRFFSGPFTAVPLEECRKIGA